MTATTAVHGDDRLVAVVDIHTGETVFGPAAKAQVSHWIIQDGYWRVAHWQAPLRVVDVLPEGADAR